MSLEKRARDVDRQLGVDALQSALAQGQLKQHEYEERVGRVMQAATLGDIDKELDDLQVERGSRGVDSGNRTYTHVVRGQNWSELPLSAKIFTGLIFGLVLVVFGVVGYSLVTGTPPDEWFGNDQSVDVTFDDPAFDEF